jgi:hypothetical protein
MGEATRTMNLTSAIERLAVAIEDNRSKPDPMTGFVQEMLELARNAASLCPACRGSGFVLEYHKVADVTVAVKVDCPVCEGSGKVKSR